MPQGNSSHSPVTLLRQRVRARKIARDIAVRIENELKYPGEIRVAVIRETRAIEFAR